MKYTFFALAVVTLLLFPVKYAVGSGGLRTVALSGDTPADMASGVNFLSFGTPVLNNNGQTAFVGEVTGAGIIDSNNQGIWSEGGGSLGLVALEGNAAPDTGTGVQFGPFGFDQLVLNDNGQTAFVGTVAGTGVDISNNSAIWSEGGGSGLALVAREGTQAPGLGAGVSFQDFNNRHLLLNDQGHAAFRAFLIGPGIDNSNVDAIWSERGGNGLDLVVRSGTIASGAGVNFDSFNFSEPVLNNSGQTSFRGGVFISNFLQTGVWKEESSNVISVVALPGSQVPDTDIGVTFDGAAQPVINDLGQTAFRGQFRGTGVTSLNQTGIISEAGGNGLELIAREGDQAPGVEPGVVHNGFNFPIINNRGDTVFVGNLREGGVASLDNGAVWRDGVGTNLELVVREGDEAPETESQVRFSFDFLISNSISLNDIGQTAFISRLDGPSIDDTNDVGIWAEDSIGNLRLIARTGDLLDVSDTSSTPDLRTISELRFTNVFNNTGNADGRPSSFNDRGELAFLARFTDGSEGVFVSSLVAVPEPSSLLVVVGLVLTRLCLSRLEL